MTHLAKAEELARDRNAFAEFYHTLRPALFRTSLQVVRRKQDAEEIANDAFVRFLNAVRRGAFRGECTVETYLHMIARNASVNRLQHNWAKRHFGTESFDHPDSLLHEELECLSLSPLAGIEMEEVATLIKQAMPLLVENHQTILYLRLIKECSYEEIAHYMRIEIGTVKSSLARARACLRRKCEQLIHDSTYWQT
jgi:RNA polymerase sigma-70 factor (ECF subfamily)